MILVRQKGLTLVEILIVLTITAALFASIIRWSIAIRASENLKQGTIKFSALINEVVSDVSNNKYHLIEGKSCKFEPKEGTTNKDKFTISDDDNARRGRSGVTPNYERRNSCSHVGLVLQVGVGSEDGQVTSKARNYAIHTMLGNSEALDDNFRFFSVDNKDNNKNNLGSGLRLISANRAFETSGKSGPDRQEKIFNVLSVDKIYYEDKDGNKYYLHGLAVVYDGQNKTNPALQLENHHGKLSVRLIPIMSISPKSTNTDRLSFDEFGKQVGFLQEIKNNKEERIDNSGSSLSPKLVYGDILNPQLNFQSPIYVCLSGSGNRKSLVKIGSEGQFSQYAREVFELEKGVRDKC